MPVDAVSLEVFKNLFISMAEEMGVTLTRTAYSPNIKERRDFSCALFDDEGRMVAQAAHIPVHLGSMPASVEAALANFQFTAGDVVILNDPYLGGTHLPDITLVAPVFVEEDDNTVLAGFVANRGHHADIGGMTPGSLPLSTELYQEGFIIPPLKLAAGGALNEEVVELLCRNSRTPHERRGDLSAQLAAIRTGELRLQEIVARYGLSTAREHMGALMDYSERLMRASIQAIPDGTYSFRDYMDGDGLTDEPVVLAASVTVAGDEATVDFTGTAEERPGVHQHPHCGGLLRSPIRAAMRGAIQHPTQPRLYASAPPGGTGAEPGEPSATSRGLRRQRGDLPAGGGRTLRGAGQGAAGEGARGQPGHDEQPSGGRASSRSRRALRLL